MRDEDPATATVTAPGSDDQPAEAAETTALALLRARAEAAERRAEAAEQLLELLGQNAGDVLLHYAPDGTLLWASPSLRPVFGWDPDQVVGTKFRLGLPEDRGEHVRMAQRALEAKEPVVAHRTRVRTAAGEIRWADTATRFVTSGDGRVSSVVLTLRDATARADAESARIASEQRFRLAMADAAIGMCLVAPDGRFLEVNPALCRFFGRTTAELIRTQWRDLTLPDDLEIDHDQLQATFEGRIDTYRVSKRYLHADGTIRIGDLSVSAIRDDEGEVQYFVSQIVDVTDRVAIEQALAESEEHFRLLAENSADVVFRLGLDFRIEWVSPSVTRVLGWEPEDLIGRAKDDLVHPDDTAGTRAHTAALTDAAERRSRALQIVRADGDAVWFSEMTTPIRDTTGAVSTYVVALRNIDAETRAAQALALSEQRFRLAMESAPSGMALVDLDRKFVQVNQALVRMLHRDADWLLQHRVPDILPDTDQELDLKMRALVLSGRVSSAVREHRLELPDKKRIWVQHSVGLLRDDEGTPLSYISQFLDVTDARESRRALEFLATHDSLTQLANRHALVDQMERILTRHPRSGGNRLGVLFIDLDSLKPINDRFGHATGDRVITDVAALIRDHVRAGDLVARFGGDEFVALLPDLATLDDARAVGEKVRTIIAESRGIGGLGFPVTVSVGAAVAEPGDSPDRVMSRADTAVYRAKNAGGNRTEAAAAASGTESD